MFTLFIGQLTSFIFTKEFVGGGETTERSNDGTRMEAYGFRIGVLQSIGT